VTCIHNELPALKDLPTHNAGKSPDAVAFEDATESVDWAEFKKRAERAVDAFAKCVSTGDRIGFYCESSVRHAVLVVGVLKAGAVATNLHNRIALASFRCCLETIRPRVLVLNAERSDSFAEMTGSADRESISEVLTIGEAHRKYERPIEGLPDDAAAESPDVLVEEDNVAVVAWTSASTG
jgi:acyl-CoA synthetase (AMP-forming)/AMP-acid ligase II